MRRPKDLFCCALAAFFLTAAFPGRAGALDIVNKTDRDISAEVQYTTAKDTLRKKKLVVPAGETCDFSPADLGEDIGVIRVKDRKAGQLMELNSVDMNGSVAYNGENLVTLKD